jgi:hypothetical protein
LGYNSVIVVVTAVVTVVVTRSGKVLEESENSALNPLRLAMEPRTLKHTVTNSFAGNVCVDGVLLPQNLDVPLIEGLMVTQESDMLLI